MCDVTILIIRARAEITMQKKLERIFDEFLKQHTKMLLGDFDVKVGEEDIFQPLIENES